MHRVDDATGTVSGLGLIRRAGRPRFTARDAQVVHVIASEVPWLHDAATPQTKGEGVQNLPPRLRPVMAMLIDGKTRKQIAHGLGLSVHTVADYIKDIYKHFGVSGRVGLMHHFMSGEGREEPDKN